MLGTQICAVYQPVCMSIKLEKVQMDQILYMISVTPRCDNNVEYCI